jgi:MFS transporter, PCFT/HCP family, solute carrier family 46, member 3
MSMFLFVRSNGQYIVLILLVIANLIYCFGVNGVGSIFTLYTMNIPFYWDSIAISTYTFYNTALSLFLSLIVSKLLKINDIIICFLSAFSYFISLFIFGFATTSFHIYLGAGISAISGLEFAYVRSIVSKLVTKYEIADALTIITVVDTIAAVIASIMFPYIYSNYVSSMNALIFLIVAPFVAITCILHL